MVEAGIRALLDPPGGVSDGIGYFSPTDVARDVYTIMAEHDEERSALLALADSVDAWLLKPTPLNRRRVYAARDELARVRGKV